ncbi:hypothetical protein [Streptomyces phaeochromogenes]|uniref:hypothetical protein n=1 Tax=Streptomyces phaeochromogenes TaxID=1923 RepID=UPI00371C7489
MERTTEKRIEPSPRAELPEVVSANSSPFLGWVTFGFTAVCAVGGTVIALAVSAPVGLALLAVAAPAITIQIRR